MVDDVARALCMEAGGAQHAKMPEGESVATTHCLHCDDNGNCTLIASFRNEARYAILAAYKWHKKERRWPGFCK